MIGGIAPTQEVLDICGKHNFWPDCDIITADKIGEAWEQLCGEGGNKDGNRYVIDIKKSISDGIVPS